MENLDTKHVEETKIEDESVGISDDLLSDSENQKIMSDIKEAQSQQQKSKKKKSGKKKVKKTYSLIIASCVTGILCGGLGLVGGYFLYTTLKPETVYEADAGDLRSVEKRGDASSNLLETFKNDPYNLANYSMIKYAKRRTTLTLGYTFVLNFSAEQTVHAATINTKDRTFNQNISSTAPGSFIEINTAFRFYDNRDEIVTAYEYKTPDQWTAEAAATNNYTYNEYIEKYGKLHQGLYIVDDDKNYVTNDISQTENELLSTVSIFQITSKSVKESAINQREDGKYEISMTLYSNRACFYSSRNIKANGDLPKNPAFKETVTATYVLDENFNLYSSSQAEDYRVTLGVEVDVETDGFSRYFYSDTDELIVNGETIKIPEMDETFPLAIDEKGDFVQ